MPAPSCANASEPGLLNHNFLFGSGSQLVKKVGNLVQYLLGFKMQAVQTAVQKGKNPSQKLISN